MEEINRVHGGQRLIVHDVEEISLQSALLAAQQAEMPASESLILIDRHHHYVSVDDAFCRLVGAQQKEMIGQPIGLRIGLNTYEQHIQPFVDRALTGEVTALQMLTTHETLGTLRLTVVCYPCLDLERNIGYVLMRVRETLSGAHLQLAEIRRKQRRSALHSLDVALSGEAKLEMIGALAVHSVMEQTTSCAVTVWQWHEHHPPQDAAPAFTQHDAPSQATLGLAPGFTGGEHAARQTVAAAIGNGDLPMGERLSVPLKHEGVVLGELVIEQSAGKTVRGEERSFVDEVAKRLAQAIFRDHLREQFQNYTVSLERIAAQRTQEVTRRRQTSIGLHEVLALLISNRPLSAILDYIIRQAETILGADGVSILEVHEDADKVSYTPLQFDDPFSIVTEADLAQVQTTIVNVVRQRRPLIGDSEIWLDANEGRYHAHLVTPMLAADALVGVVVFFFMAQRSLTDDEVETAAVLSDQILFALLSDRLQRRAQEGAALKERERLANNLHDAATQSIYSLSLWAEAGRRFAQAGNLERTQEYLQQIAETVQQTMKQMRLLLYELRPNVLEQTGLLGALQQRLDAVETGAGITATLEDNGPFRLPPHVEDGLYRISQEALNNALSHSAASRVTVSVKVDGDIVTMAIVDDGIGFELTPELDAHGIGINQMRIRAKALNADLTIESAPGQGTRIQVVVLVPGIGATM